MDPPKFCHNPFRVHTKRFTKFVSRLEADPSFPIEYHEKFFCFNCLQRLRKLHGNVPDNDTTEGHLVEGAPVLPVLEFPIQAQPTSSEEASSGAASQQGVACLELPLQSQGPSTSCIVTDRQIVTGTGDSSAAVGEVSQHIDTEKQETFEDSQKLSTCSFVSKLEPLCDRNEQFIPFNSLSLLEQKAILISYGKKEEETKKYADGFICSCHYASHLECFELATEIEPKLKPFCCNPFTKHFKVIQKQLRQVTVLTAVQAKKVGFNLRLKSYLCDSCRLHFLDILSRNNQLEGHDSVTPSQSSSATSQEDIALSGASSHVEGLSPSVIKEELNSELNLLGLSPLSLSSSCSETVKLRYARQKLNHVNKDVTKRLCKALDVEERDLEGGDHSTLAEDLTNLLVLVKEKLKTADRKNEVKLLTLCPDTWTTSYAASFFGVSRYTIQQARALKREKGVLESPTYASRTQVQPEMLKIVEDFYCDDRYSRQMPGMKDRVSVGHGEYVSKRLVLCNLVELYAEFKEQHSDVAKHIGKSVFISLRPKWCVLAGSSGTHNVCVCVIHQNAKMLLRALRLDPSLKNIIPVAVCDINDRDCLMGVCEKCPLPDQIVDKITAMLRSTRAEDESEEQFSFFLQTNLEYKQWTATDRDEISTKSGSVSEVVEVFVSNFKKVIRHDFIAKQQSEFIKQEKENLSDTKAIILMDFSMNYTCVVQDASQQFHWSKKGITLHPVVMYFKDSDGNLTHKSLCFISDDIKHDVTQVRLYQERTITYIKKNYPSITEVMYVTDGCAAQYKNCTSLYNLCQQAKKLGLKITWCFCATSHGKCPCDGIGGLIKREARKASLQRVDSGHILNARQLFEYCKSAKMGESIDFFLVESSEILTERNHEKNLKPVTIPGTRSFHHFTPVSGTNAFIECKRTSSDTEVSLVHNLMPSDEDDIECEENFETGSYVAVMIGPKIHMAFVSDINTEEGEAELSLLKPPIPAAIFTWSESPLGYVAPICDIICSIMLTEREDLKFELDMSTILKLRLMAREKRKKNLKERE